MIFWTELRKLYNFPFSELALVTKADIRIFNLKEVNVIDSLFLGKEPWEPLKMTLRENRGLNNKARVH